ncbi:hypothetical protein HZY97_17680 [Sphingomonas sp. R-74633]|uniref:hypothetical protein n=1 Tax=Sphingomonas sp. R-74633 TaxID=2751188 RepID=UPI0015D41C93|nr:hypothetical protein [Sphingomonas sp. R-74633]NYT42608.1 hypothetical protein [Sphingomonas sp. R-74633]
MKRFPIPPTKYDPMRPVQAKMAAPTGGPGVGIPPTRYGAAGPIQARTATGAFHAPTPAHFGHANHPIQRAAAANPVAANATDWEPHMKPDAEDTPAMAYVRSFSMAKLKSYQDSDVAAIGSDTAKLSDIDKWLRNNEKFDCLAICLVIAGEKYSAPRNAKWIGECIKSKKKFRMPGTTQIILDEINSPKKLGHNSSRKAYFAQAAAKAGDVKKEDPIKTADEVRLLLAGGYRWNGNKTFFEHNGGASGAAAPQSAPQVAPPKGGAAPGAMAGASASAQNNQP